MKRRHLYDDVDLDHLFLNEIPESIAMYACHGSYIVTSNRLTSLKNSPVFVKHDFSCSGNRLTSLVGGPEEVQGRYICTNNLLVSLEGIARIIGSHLYCQNNQLRSLNGIPTLKSGATLACGSNNISSLTGYGFESIKLTGFYCEMNNLTSLQGAPEFLQGDFDCSNNPITSFIGAPKFIGGDFYAGELTQLQSLEGFPERVENNVFIDKRDLIRIFGSKPVPSLTSQIRNICKVKGNINISYQ